MSFLRGTEEYYQKFIELQEKLRKSEEERLVLEMKFNEMVQVTREEEQAYYRKLRNQYKRFLEEDRRRQERNERIMRILERIEGRAAILAAKTERFEYLRQQYQAYLQRIFYNTKHTCESVKTLHIPEQVSTILEEKSDLYDNYGLLPKKSHADTFEGINHQAKDLYEHPLIRKALSGNKGESNFHSKADVVKQYLRSLATPISGEEVLKATRSSEKIPSVHTSELADSYNDCLHKDDYSYYKTNAGNIADQIINSINSRPKLSSPHHDRYVSGTHHQDQNRGKWPEKSFCGTTYSPKYSIEKIGDDVEIFNEKDLRYKFDKDKTEFPSKTKETGKKSESMFQELSGKKDDKIVTSDIPKISVREVEDADDDMPTVNDEVLETTDLKKQSFVNEGYQLNDIETDNNAVDEHQDIYEEQNRDPIEYSTAPPLDNAVQELEEDKNEIIEKSEIEEISEESAQKDKNAIVEENNIAADEGAVYEDIGQFNQDTEEYQQPDQDINSVAFAGYEDSHYYHGNDDQPALDFQDGPLTGQYTELNSNNDTQCRLQNEQDDPNVPDHGATVAETEQQETMQAVQGNSEKKQFIATNAEQPDDYNQLEVSHQKDDIPLLNKKSSDYFTPEFEESQSGVRHNEEAKSTKQPVVHKDDEKNQPPEQYDEKADPAMQYDEKGRPLVQYDEKGQPVMQYDEKDQHFMQYNKGDEAISQYDDKGQHLIQYDERDQPITQYDQDGQFIYQYDQNGQPIMQYDDNGQPLMQYDENSQPIMHYDDRSQPILQYDEHGQPIMQYDENGQPIMQYDANGQPILPYNYDENGQPVMYDQQGQPIYQYEGQEYYPANQMYNMQQYSEEPQTVTANTSKAEVTPKDHPVSPAKEKQYNSTENTKDISKQQVSQNITETNSNADADISFKEQLLPNSSKQQPSPGNEKKTSKSEKLKDNSKQQALKQTSPNKDKKANVIDMLDTDTESIRQESKVSNDSDFDFSSK